MIGCGLDRLNWDKIKSMLFDIYSDIDIEVIVVKLP